METSGTLLGRVQQPPQLGFGECPALVPRVGLGVEARQRHQPIAIRAFLLS
jgi:hypothetical protein